MRFLLMFVIDAGLIGLYLYSKLSPIKDKLDAKHRGWYDTADKIFGWAARPLAKSFKPYKLGEGVYMDMGQFVLFAIMIAATIVLLVGR